MHRAFISKDQLQPALNASSFVLPKDIAHRFVRVLRLKTGSVVELFDGHGTRVQGELDVGPQATLEQIRVFVDESRMNSLVLAQAMIKTDKLEWLVQKAVELGATAIVLFDAERSIVRWDDKAPQKLERLERIAADASRQCGRSDMPVLLGPLNFDELKDYVADFKGLSLLGDLGAGVPALVSLLGGEPRPTLILVGPEGDFSKTEKEQLFALGVKGCRFASHVLRSETAGMAALAIMGAHRMS
jgi:16S rRNA (uracil1498-N3)-methyltransferase